MDALLAAGCRALAETIRLTGSPILYQRETASVTVTAATGRSQFEINDEHGNTSVVWNDRDFLVPCTDLVLNGVATQPKRGDMITTATGAQYVVAGPEGTPEWQYLDPFQSVYRVHTTLVAK